MTVRGVLLSKAKLKNDSVIDTVPLQHNLTTCSVETRDMALQVSARVSHIRALPCINVPVCHGGADLQRAGVKFKHTLMGSPQVGVKSATSPVRGHVSASLRAERFSISATTASLWKSSQANGTFLPRGRRSWLGQFVLGAALGVSTVAVVQSLHTGSITAMALKVDLDSAEGDWKKTKGENV